MKRLTYYQRFALKNDLRKQQLKNLAFHTVERAAVNHLFRLAAESYRNADTEAQEPICDNGDLEMVGMYIADAKDFEKLANLAMRGKFAAMETMFRNMDSSPRDNALESKAMERLAKYWRKLNPRHYDRYSNYLCTEEEDR